MKFEEKEKLLRQRAESIIDFTPHQIYQATPDEIQRLFYDLQVYQIELKMQNDELELAQKKLLESKNRYHFLYHQIPVGIAVLDNQGFIEDVNLYFVQLMKTDKNRLLKKHLSSLIADEDKNLFINRFSAFFNAPENKSLLLHFKKDEKVIGYFKMQGTIDREGDLSTESRKLVISITDISDVVEN